MSHACKGVKELHGAGFETQRSSQKHCSYVRSQWVKKIKTSKRRLHSNAINGTHIWRKMGEKEALTNITTLICAKFNRMVLGPCKFCRPCSKQLSLDSCINAKIVNISDTGNEVIGKKGFLNNWRKNYHHSTSPTHVPFCLCFTLPNELEYSPPPQSHVASTKIIRERCCCPPPQGKEQPSSAIHGAVGPRFQGSEGRDKPQTNSFGNAKKGP